MKARIMTFLWLALVLAPLIGSRTVAQIGQVDTVRLGCPIAVHDLSPGDSLNIPVYLWNDEYIGGFTFGFHWNSSRVQILSWDVDSSVIPVSARSGILSRPVPDSNQFLAGWVDWSGDSLIPPTPGNHALLLGKLHMRVLSDVCTGVDIDSATIVFPTRWKVSTPTGEGESPAYSDCGTVDVIITKTDFGTNPVAGFAPLLAQFADSTCPVPVSWLWHFGDGNSSALQNPSRYLGPIIRI